MPGFVEIGSVILVKRIFKDFVKVIHYFVIFSPWKRAGPFTCTNLNSIQEMMLCAKILENFFIVFFTILLLSPLEKGRGPSFDQT